MDGGEPPPAEPLADAIAFVLEAPSLYESLCQLPEAGLAALLGEWEARIERAPDGFPRASLPLVLVAWVGPGEMTVRGRAGGKLFQRELPAPRDTGAFTEEWRDGGWTALRNDHGVWTVTLRLPGGGDAVRVQMQDSGHLACVPLDVPVERAPDRPAIALYW